MSPHVLDAASRLSNLSAHLQQQQALTPAHQELVTYHISALESMLSPSSTSSIPHPLPSSSNPKAQAPMSPPSSATHPSPSIPSSFLSKQPTVSTSKFLNPQSIPQNSETLLAHLTAVTASLRSRHSETQSLHSLLLLKLSAKGKRIMELEGRVREFESSRGFDIETGAGRRSQDKFEVRRRAEREEVDDWELRHTHPLPSTPRRNGEGDPFVDKRHGRDIIRSEGLREKKVRTSGGMGVYGINSTGRTKDRTPEAKVYRVDEGWDIIHQIDHDEGESEEDEWKDKWADEAGDEDGEDTAAPTDASSNSNSNAHTHTHTQADIETWQRHWQEVERAFSPRRGPGRRLGSARELGEV